MPGGDRTGPMGMGTMTGRGAGLCTGAGAPGYAAGRFAGRGGQRGRGFDGGGRGWRNRYYATGQPGWMMTSANPMAEQNEALVLKNQAETLQSELNFVKQRLAEITPEPSAD